MPLTDPQKIDLEVIVYGTIAAVGGDSQKTVNPLHYRRTNFIAPYSASAFLTAFHAKAQADWLAAANVNWTWDKTSVRVLNSPLEIASEATVNVAGGVVGDMLPSYCAAVLSKRTALRGRSRMGRMYFAGVPETGATGNALTAGQKALMDVLAGKLDDVITDANGLTFTPTVLSRKLSNLTIDPSTIVATDISAIVARSVLGRQANRKSKVS